MQGDSETTDSSLVSIKLWSGSIFSLEALQKLLHHTLITFTKEPANILYIAFT
jgi:hypothetical protein